MNHFTNCSLFFVLVCLIAFPSRSHAQNTVTIPDPNLVTFLQTFYTSCMNGNQLDTTCVLVTNAQYMSVANRNISNFEGLQYFRNLRTLNINDNPATSFPGPFASTLEEFEAEDVPLTSIPAIPNSLVRLTLIKNNLTTLPALTSPNMTILHCEQNQLTTIPSFPPNLFFCDLSFNQLTALPAIPASLDYLNVEVNQISNLPTLSPNLSYLDCSSNLLSSLPTIPNTVWYLDIGVNSLSSLQNPLPPNLRRFFCSNNDLTSIPSLPNGMMTFACGNNLLTTLPAIPPTVTNFACQGNQLTSLPYLPDSLIYVHVQDNNLTSLPNIPDSILTMNCSGNQISCLPTLPAGANYNFTLEPNPFSCLPNYGAWMSTALLAYPLCVAGDPIINPDGCLDGSGVYGSAYGDDNLNCQFDGNESGLPNIPFDLYDGNNALLQQTASTYTGAYYFNADSGLYTAKLDTAAVPFLSVNCGATDSVNLSPSAPFVSGVDFDVDCDGIDIGAQSVVTTGIIFPGQPHQLNVFAGDLSQWYGLACAAGSSGQIEVTVNGNLNYTGVAAGSATPTIVGNTYTYTVNDFANWDFDGGVGLLFEVDTTAQAGDTVCVSVMVTSNGNDVNAANNSLDFCYNVVNSYDPNMKEVFPLDVAPAYEDDFTYTIHFQNTGNAPAFNIRLRDTLDTNLDWSTFEVLSYSHDNQVSLRDNYLTVFFPNIMLADSTTDYEGSMGYFQYKIKPKANLPVDTEIYNRAGIYFDFNPPIITNTTINRFVLTTSISSSFPKNALKVYPNPSAGVFVLELDEMKGNVRYELYDVLGKPVRVEEVVAAHTEIDVRSHPSGIYLLRVIRADGAVATMRLMKE